MSCFLMTSDLFCLCDRIPLRWAQPCRSSTTWGSWEKPSALWWGATGAPSRTTSAKLWTSRGWLSLPTPKVAAAEKMMRKCGEVVLPHRDLTFFFFSRSSRQSSAAHAREHASVPSGSLDQPGETNGPDLHCLQTGQAFFEPVGQTRRWSERLIGVNAVFRCSTCRRSWRRRGILSHMSASSMTSSR